VILLTGDSGFIGRYLVPSLVAEGHSVRGVDLHPAEPPASFYEHLTGDILDPSILGGAGSGVDTIVHLAAEHKDFGIAPEQYHRVNVQGTEALLALAERVRARKFVFFSQGNADETTQPLPENPYGASKLQAEAAVTAWANADPARAVVIVRPTVIFGPWSKANIFKLIRYVCDRKFIWVGNGENIKSIAYVKNLVAATAFLLKRMQPGIEIYNYADGPHRTTRELVGLIARAAGVPEPGLKLPLAPALAMARGIDLVAKLSGRDFPVTSARLKKFNATTLFRAEKIRAAGFVPPYTIEEGIQENVRWYLDEYKARRIHVSDSYEH
jgi:nucleoside-diphosphate-sugar epimerase